MSDNQEQFFQALDRIDQEVIDGLQRLHAGATVAAFETAVERTPVDTGALRAENIITEGPANRIVYEGRSRPGPDRRVSVAGGSLEPPSIGDAKLALESVSPFSLLTLLNQRFYASFVHDGTSRMAGRPWMEHARDTAERTLAAGAKGLEQRLQAIV